MLDRKVGEYELPEGASLIACGNRETYRGVVHRLPAPLASRFVHLDIDVDADEWLDWGAANGITPEVGVHVGTRPKKGARKSLSLELDVAATVDELPFRPKGMAVKKPPDPGTVH